MISDWNKNYSKSLREYLLNSDNQEFLKDLFTSDEEGNLLDLVFSASQSNQNVSEEKIFNITETREVLSAYFAGNFRYN